MNKKGESEGVSTFVKATAALITLVVFLFIVPTVGQKLMAAESKGSCEWSVLVSALTRTPGFGFENIPAACKAKYRNVTLADIQANYPAASTAIEGYSKKGPAYADISRMFSTPSAEQLAEWSMNKIVADEMVDCWDKVWHGGLPLFDEWWKLIGKRDLEDGLVGFEHPPTFCVVCARLKFAEDAKIAFAVKPSITSLAEWMRTNPVPRTNTPYYLYVLPDWLKSFSPNYPYTVGEPLAIVYARINYHKAGQWASYVSRPINNFIGFPEDEEIPRDKIDKIAVVSYDKVILPYEKGGANCDYVID